MLYDVSDVNQAQMISAVSPQIVQSSYSKPEKSNGVMALFDIDRFTNKLKSIRRSTSTSKCAKSIRMALQYAGAQISSHPVAASDWGKTLLNLGYREITPSFENPKPGDIYIIHRTNQHRYGHIAGYTGKGWVSDFKQSSYDVYRDKNVSYSYYRPGS